MVFHSGWVDGKFDEGQTRISGKFVKMKIFLVLLVEKIPQHLMIFESGFAQM